MEVAAVIFLYLLPGNAPQTLLHILAFGLHVSQK